MGDLDRALAELEQALPDAGAEALGDLGRLSALAGREAAARRYLRDLEEMALLRHVSPFNPAVVHLGLGEHETALDLLEAALEQRSWYVSWLGVAPYFDCVAEHPRYVDLCRRARLA
jgi:tetratricopeptide (TPR) repeat protein